MQKYCLKIGVFFLIGWGSLCQSACSEVIEMQQGTRIEGSIVKWDEKGIIVDSGYGVQLRYFYEEIDLVDGKPIEEIKPVPVKTKPLVRKPLKQPAIVNKPKPEFYQQSPDVNKADNVLIERKIVNSYSKPTPQTEWASFKRKVIQIIKINIQSYKDSLRNNPRMHLYFLSLFLVGWPIGSFPLYIIAKRYDETRKAWAFFPIMNLFLLTKLADKSKGWAILCFFPILSVIIVPFFWIEISGFLRKSKFFGFLCVVPGLIFLIPWYYAVDSSAQYFGDDIDRREGYNPYYHGPEHRKHR